ncbi:MAG: TIGR00730 family Rossman fold protein [Planctomycetaceae bacterium]|nr:TIGR00730 family Rossman fold protein [Planctomycetaceae bacterium]
MTLARICVFCGSRSGAIPDYALAAHAVGRHLAEQQHTLVYGGGSTGIMGAIADSVLENHGQIIGVIPEHLARVELMHARVADMRVTRDMHERKAIMHQLADAYITLPGGYGTLEELFETVTWAQLELHQRPVALINLNGVYDGLLTQLNRMIHDGFLSTQCLELLTVTTSVEELIAWIDALPCQ